MTTNRESLEKSPAAFPNPNLPSRLKLLISTDLQCQGKGILCSKSDKLRVSIKAGSDA